MLTAQGNGIEKDGDAVKDEERTFRDRLLSAIAHDCLHINRNF